MKKLLGVLFVLVMVFVLANRVNAASLTLTDVQNEAQSLANADDKTMVFGNGGDDFTVSFTGEQGQATFKWEYKEIKYTTYSEVGNDAIRYLVNAVASLQGSSLTFNDVYANLGNGQYCENNVEGTRSGENITYFRMNIDKFGTDTCSSDGSEGSGGNGGSSNSNSTKPSSNPKTGVFVPVVGISVLIVASVVCLLWISKKNVYKGF